MGKKKRTYLRKGCGPAGDALTDKRFGMQPPTTVPPNIVQGTDITPPAVPRMGFRPRKGYGMMGDAKVKIAPPATTTPITPTELKATDSLAPVAATRSYTIPEPEMSIGPQPTTPPVTPPAAPTVPGYVAPTAVPDPAADAAERARLGAELEFGKLKDAFTYSQDALNSANRDAQSTFQPLFNDAIHAAIGQMADNGLSGSSGTASLINRFTSDVGNQMAAYLKPYRDQLTSAAKELNARGAALGQQAKLDYNDILDKARQFSLDQFNSQNSVNLAWKNFAETQRQNDELTRRWDLQFNEIDKKMADAQIADIARDNDRSDIEVKAQILNAANTLRVTVAELLGKLKPGTKFANVADLIKQFQTGDPRESYDWQFIRQGHSDMGDPVSMIDLGSGETLNAKVARRSYAIDQRRLALEAEANRLARDRFEWEKSQVDSQSGNDWQTMAALASQNYLDGKNNPTKNLLPSQLLQNFQASFAGTLGGTWTDALNNPETSQMAEGVIRSMYSNPAIADAVIKRLREGDAIGIGSKPMVKPAVQRTTPIQDIGSTTSRFLPSAQTDITRGSMFAPLIDSNPLSWAVSQTWNAAKPAWKWLNTPR